MNDCRLVDFIGGQLRDFMGALDQGRVVDVQNLPSGEVEVVWRYPSASAALSVTQWHHAWRAMLWHDAKARLETSGVYRCGEFNFCCAGFCCRD